MAALEEGQQFAGTTCSGIWSPGVPSARGLAPVPRPERFEGAHLSKRPKAVTPEVPRSVYGSTHFDLCFKQHLKVSRGVLLYLDTMTGLWLRSAHRLGVGAIEYEKDIVEISK